MPYTINTLPSYVANKSEKIKLAWLHMYNEVVAELGEAKALMFANTWLKKQLTVAPKIEAKTLNSPKLEVLSFVASNEGFISKTEDGQDYVEYTLTDIHPDKEGDSYPAELLQKWTDYINSGNAIIGDIDHEEYNKWIASGLSESEIIAHIKNKPGIAKAIKAFFNNGSMKIRTFIDKRYNKLVKAANGVSLEAIVSRNSEGKIVDGSLLGFTFGVNQLVANPRAIAA